MKSYFNLQLKRYLKIFPFILVVVLLLCAAFGTVYVGTTQKAENSEEKQRFKIAITGDTENNYLQIGLAALKNFDATKFSMEIVEMSETEAAKALEKGEISAYAVLPKSFMEDALVGKQPEKIKYVTTPGGGGLVTMFKNELTTVITNMVVYSEKGVYGLSHAMQDHGFDDTTKEMNILNLQYIDLIFNRGKLVEVQELGISDGLSTTEHLISGILVLILVFMGIPYAVIAIKKDYALNKILASRGYSTLRQTFSEFIAHFISLLSVLVIAALILFGVAAGFGVIKGDVVLPLLSESPKYLLKVSPILLFVTAFNLFIFEISDNMVSGVLLHFFSALALCYISGCLYPIYAFPKIIQQISIFLPTGLARGYLAAIITESNSLKLFLGLACYVVFFFTAAALVRLYKVRFQRG